jgi:hypothetical protein
VGARYEGLVAAAKGVASGARQPDNNNDDNENGKRGAITMKAEEPERGASE